MFTDDFTRYNWIYFMRTKEEALQQFQEFKILVENNNSRTIAALQIDQGVKYLSNANHDFCVQSGIKHDLTCA